MAVIVEEIMNRELFSVRPDEPSEPVLRYLHLLGASGAPVLDDEGKPVGMITLRDFVEPKKGDLVGERMTTPALTVPAKAGIAEAGRRMAEAAYHHLAAIDEHGRAVGFVSALDVVRGLLGLPSAHPRQFPHYDKATGLTWIDDRALSFDHVEAAPAEAGVIVLLHGGPGEPERVVWAETSQDMRARLVDLLAHPEAQRPPLAGWLRAPGMRFRCAAAADAADREHALEAVLDQAAALLGLQGDCAA